MKCNLGGQASSQPIWAYCNKAANDWPPTPSGVGLPSTHAPTRLFIVYPAPIWLPDLYFFGEKQIFPRGDPRGQGPDPGWFVALGVISAGAV